MKNKSTMVTFDGKPVFNLNHYLLDSQDVWHNLQDLKDVHEFRLILWTMMREARDHKTLKSLAEDMTLCEFELQRLWGFPQDRSYHRFWELPQCECPKMDNEERYGTDYTVVTSDCPLHGDR